VSGDGRITLTDVTGFAKEGTNGIRLSFGQAMDALELFE
jgi:hypothetical protein